MPIGTTKYRYLATMSFKRWPLGDRRLIEAQGVSEPEACAACIAIAEADGWTPPKWWQWWRRRDSSKPFANRLL